MECIFCNLFLLLLFCLNEHSVALLKQYFMMAKPKCCLRQALLNRQQLHQVVINCWDLASGWQIQWPSSLCSLNRMKSITDLTSLSLQGADAFLRPLQTPYSKWSVCVCVTIKVTGILQNVFLPTLLPKTIMKKNQQ